MGLRSDALRPCGGCSRHLYGEQQCPFCGVRISVVSILPFAISLLIVGGCSDRAIGPDDASGSVASATTGDETTGGVATTASTTTPIDPETSTSMMMTAEGSTTADSDDGPDMTSAASGFIYGVPDGNTVTIECSVWDQDCPRGEKCMPWANDGGDAWNATRCSPVAGDPAAPSEACQVEGGATSGVDDCELGAMCFYADPMTLAGTCVSLCTGSENDPSCADASTACAITNEGTITLCLPQCDPLAQGCPDGQSCIGVDTDFVCVPDGSADGGAYGDACERWQLPDDCDSGLSCVAADEVPGCASESCCSAYCELGVAGADESCPGFDDGQRCVAALESPPPEHADVGVCAIP